MVNQPTGTYAARLRTQPRQRLSLALAIRAQQLRWGASGEGRNGGGHKRNGKCLDEAIAGRHWLEIARFVPKHLVPTQCVRRFTTREQTQQRSNQRLYRLVFVRTSAVHERALGNLREGKGWGVMARNTKMCTSNSVRAIPPCACWGRP